MTKQDVPSLATGDFADRGDEVIGLESVQTQLRHAQGIENLVDEG